MQCQQCPKPATFHITERVGEEESWEELHLCEDCVRDYLNPASGEAVEEEGSLMETLSEHIQIGQTAEELARLDQKACPVCGITFYEFRNQGRLGCPHDYVCFEEELRPLVINIHGESVHSGKQPRRGVGEKDMQTRLILLRREMREAVQEENYERASELRDEIRGLENAR